MVYHRCYLHARDSLWLIQTQQILNHRLIRKGCSAVITEYYTDIQARGQYGDTPYIATWNHPSESTHGPSGALLHDISRKARTPKRL